MATKAKKEQVRTLKMRLNPAYFTDEQRADLIRRGVVSGELPWEVDVSLDWPGVTGADQNGRAAMELEAARVIADALAAGNSPEVMLKARADRKAHEAEEERQRREWCVELVSRLGDMYYPNCWIEKSQVVLIGGGPDDGLPLRLWPYTEKVPIPKDAHERAAQEANQLLVEYNERRWKGRKELADSIGAQLAKTVRVGMGVERE